MKFLMKTPLLSTVRSLFLVFATLLMALILVACSGDKKEAAAHNAAEHGTSVAQQPASQAGSADEADIAINVVARDFEFILDSNSAASGTISFVIANQGSMPHDFAITIDGERYKTEMIKPGSSASLTVKLASGSYEYICTIPGHDMLGMKGSFTVN